MNIKLKFVGSLYEWSSCAMNKKFPQFCLLSCYADDNHGSLDNLKYHHFIVI